MSSLSLLLGAVKRSFGKGAFAAQVSCPICETAAVYLDSVDFNKNCEEARGLTLEKSGEMVRYYLCDGCGFCFAPQLFAWSVRDFEQRIYNDAYVTVDPDYLSVRPTNNAELLDKTFGTAKVSHLDYGGGSGLLSKILTHRGWNSRTYDPFVDKTPNVRDLGQFDLVTAFEVFEHVPDIDALFADLHALVNPDGMILFSTLLSDGEIKRGQPLGWWYAAPRNGHISLFSSESLRMCLRQRDFNFASASANLHVAFRQVPHWATHLLR